MKKLSFKGIISFLLLFSITSFADQVTLLDGTTFVRGKGSPVIETVSFSGADTEGSFILKLYNGGYDHSQTRVASANIWLNGELIVSESEFSQQVTYLERQLVLSDSNELAVELRGTPLGQLVVNIGGEIINRPPVIISNAPDAAYEDVLFSYQVQAEDSDVLNSLSYSLTESPSGMVISHSSGELTWTPVQADVGAHPVTIAVADTEGGTTVQSFTLEVLNSNDTPVITSLPVVTALEDSLYQYQAVATDEDLIDTKTFALTIAPTGMTIDAETGLVSWTPDNNQVGTNAVTVQVADSSGATATQSYTLTVDNVNDAPVFTSEAITDTNEDASYSYILTASDEDVADSLTFSLDLAPEGMILSGNQLTWLPLQADVGEHNISVSVTDLEGEPDTQLFTLTVINVNDAPSFEIIDSQSVDATTSLNLTVIATDEDGDTVSYSLFDPPSGANIVASSGELSWTPTPEQVGEYALQIIATDGELESSLAINVTVNPPPYSAPEFIGDSPLLAFAGEEFNYQLQINAETAYTLELVSGPDGLVLDDATGIVSWLDAPIGQYEFVVKASVSQEIYATQSFTVNVIEKEQSNEGTDFWLAFGTNYVFNVEANLYVYVSSQFDTQGTVDIPLQGISIPFSVAAGEVTRVDVDSSQWVYSSSKKVQNKAIHITTDRKAVVYALNQKKDSTDGFLVLPTATLGQEYRAMTYDGGQLTLAATADNTIVDITFAMRVYLLAYQRYFEQGEMLSLSLQRGQSFAIEANAASRGTLAGSLIKSTAPLAVFSGNYCVNVPTSIRSCDHIVEQLLPSHYWGTRYLTIPLAKRFGGDLVRIVAGFDNTQIAVNGEYLATLNAGEWIDDTFHDASVIEANHPIMVAQFSKGHEIDYAQNQAFGDPFMLMLTPTEQMLSRYQFTTTDKNIAFNFVNVIASEEAMSNMLLDGSSLNTNLFSRIGNTEYYGAQLDISEGAHTLESTQPFITSIYGFGDYDSYGYQGGINLPRFSPQSNISVSDVEQDKTIGQQICLTVSLKNADLPIIGARVDVNTPNAAEKLHHYVSDTLGQITHCYYGIKPTTETLTIRSGELETQAIVNWTENNSSEPAQPIIISEPVSSAQIGSSYFYLLQAVDANQNDELNFELVDGPAGMWIDGNVIHWEPLAADEGLHQVVVGVSDRDGLTDSQSFTVLAYVGNRAPQLQTPLHDDIAYVGYSYTQRMDDIYDPDGDIVYCELLDNPITGPKSSETAPRGCFALLVFTPFIDKVGIHQLTVRLWDRSGGESFHTFELEVQENHLPELVNASAPYAKAGQPYASQIVVNDPDGQELSYYITRVTNVESGTDVAVSFLNDLKIDPTTGLISFTPTSDKAGTYDIQVKVNDAIGFSYFTIRVSVFAQDEPFVANIDVSPQFISTGETVNFAASASGVAGEVQYSLIVNGENVSLDEQGKATYTNTSEVGQYEVQLVATDQNGNIISSDSFIAVSDGADTTMPAAAISSPIDGQIITAPYDVAINAEDENLAQWRLYFTSVSSDSPVLVASGRESLAGQTIYQIDPSLLTNGLYNLNLEVVDIAGQTSGDEVSLQLDGNLKAGNFTYTVNEFTVPLAGLPISISRTYDSRRKQERGDFGYGWFLDYNLVKTEKTRVLGAGWKLNEYVTGPLGLLRNYCVESLGDILVNITLPNDEVEHFKVKASPECNETVPIIDVNLSFEPQGDTHSTLALKNNALVRLVNGQLEVVGSSEVFDANNFELTTREGYVYDFVAGADVELITDPNGNTLTFDQTGVHHSSGKSISFSRTADKISSIRPPGTGTFYYFYDTQNRLTKSQYADAGFEAYTYDYQNGLLDIEDSLGRTKVKNIYDDEGRLIAQEDNEGNRTDFNHDIDGRQSVVTDRNGNISFYYYDDRGNVTSMVDPLGNLTSYTYDANDNQLTETDPLGNTTTRTYNASNDVLTVTDPEGNTTTYTYNVRGQELTITDAKGHVYTNTYDAVGNLLTVTDPLGNVAGNNIDAQGLVSLTQDMLGNQTTFTYDAQGNKLTQTDALGVETTYTYNANNRVKSESLSRTLTDKTDYTYDNVGRVTKRADNLGTQESMAYDTLGNVKSHFDGLLNKTFEYDVYNRLISTSYDGVSATSTYDPEGNKLSDTDRNGNTTAYEYDKLNRLIKTTHPDNSFTEMAYDAAGRVLSETDENGHTSTYAYDKAGRRTKITDALGNVSEFEYDANGNLVKETDALNRITTYQYDVMDRRISVIYADSTSSSDGYDALGRNLSKTDQASKSVSYEYDALGRLTKVTDALAQVTEYQYDEAGNKVAQIDALGRTTRWEYDSRGRVIARVLPLGQRESFTYDLAGNVKSHSNFNGQTLSYTYRSQTGLLTNVTGSGINEYYQYDANGNRTVAQNDVGRYNYEYDSRNRLITETQPDGTVLAYGYDSAGNKTSLTTTYANGDARTELYTYDALNRLTSVTDNNSQTTTFTYDAVGNQTQISYPNGLISVSEYDSLNRVTAVTTKDANDNVLSRYAYSLDVTGRRLGITEHSGRSSTFTYDDVYRLTSESITDAVNGDYLASYNYDAVGNRLSQTVNGAETTYVYDDNDRLLTNTENELETAYQYDNQGNQLAENDGTTVKTYSYNANHKLTGFSDGSNSIVYQYNPDGIRVNKSLNANLTSYVVDSNQAYAQVIAEQDASDVIGKEYVFGNDLISQITGSEQHFYHYDSLGTTRELSDSSGSITDSYAYEAFGGLLDQQGDTDNNYLYTGEQFDAELDNYYLRARYYNQDVGRFTQMDSWSGKRSTPASLHKYLYAYNDPIINIDPSGHVTLVGLNVGIGDQARLTTIASGAANVTANRVAGKAVEGFVVSQLERFTAQHGGRVFTQVYFRGPGGVRFADAVVQLGNRFVAIEVKTAIPLGGRALARLGGQIKTFASGFAPTNPALTGTASEVIVITEQSAAAIEASFAAIESKVATGSVAGIYQGTIELTAVLRNILIGL